MRSGHQGFQGNVAVLGLTVSQGKLFTVTNSRYLIAVCFQFFLTLAENKDYLDGQHTVFGEVAEGFDVIKKLNEVFSDKEGRPYQDVR